METNTTPLTHREAAQLNNITNAVSNYRRALEALAGSVEQERNAIANGHRTSGIGSQRLVEAATYEATLKAILDASPLAREMEDRDAWDALVLTAYSEKVTYFSAAE